MRGDPNATYAADVFSDVLNQPNSTLQKKLVDTGLWQSIGVNYYTLDHVGPITISGQTTPDKLKSALAALDAEIQRFTDPGYISKPRARGSESAARRELRVWSRASIQLQPDDRLLVERR